MPATQPGFNERIPVTDRVADTNYHADLGWSGTDDYERRIAPSFSSAVNNPFDDAFAFPAAVEATSSLSMGDQVRVDSSSNDIFGYIDSGYDQTGFSINGFFSNVDNAGAFPNIGFHGTDVGQYQGQHPGNAIGGHSSGQDYCNPYYLGNYSPPRDYFWTQ